MAAINTVNRAYKHLEKFHSITVSFQEKGLTLADGRDIFNCVLEDYPDLSHYLADDTDIVHCVDFEHAVCKLASGNDSALTMAKRQAVAHLLKAPVNEEAGEEVQTQKEKVTPPTLRSFVIRRSADVNHMSTLMLESSNQPPA
jgi:hypothetical protein